MGAILTMRLWAQYGSCLASGLQQYEHCATAAVGLWCLAGA